MAAEGSTVIPHQVTESSTEKRQNTYFFFTSKTKHKQNNCFPGICNKKFDTYHLYLPIILQLYFIKSWFIEEILNSMKYVTYYYYSICTSKYIIHYSVYII